MRRSRSISSSSLLFLIGLFLLSIPFVNYAQTNNMLKETDLIDKFILSRSYISPIVFDSSNIKQFWINHSVFSKNNKVNILLNKPARESDFFPIQLSNVNELMDCRIDIISTQVDYSFSVYDSQQNIIAQSSQDEDFIQHHILTATFHLEDTLDNKFNLKFFSQSSDQLYIDKIILSFSKYDHSHFLSSPGVLNITRDDVTVKDADLDKDSFAVSGVFSIITGKYMIYLMNNEIETSLTIKNTGEESIHVLTGFILYSKDFSTLGTSNYPRDLSSDSVLKIVSAEKDSSKILVDHLPVSNIKGGRLAINVKEDFSDIPNSSLLEGVISDVAQSSENTFEITLSKPLSTSLAQGTKVRVHNPSAGTYFYTNEIAQLSPNEEKVLTSKIKHDDTLLLHSSNFSKTIPKGVYCIKPIILSYSIDTKKINKIEILDFTISY